MSLKIYPHKCLRYGLQTPATSFWGNDNKSPVKITKYSLEKLVNCEFECFSKRSLKNATKKC